MGKALCLLEKIVDCSLSMGAVPHVSKLFPVALPRTTESAVADSPCHVFWAYKFLVAPHAKGESKNLWFNGALNPLPSQHQNS
jgi:hypothetical protein